MHTQDTVATLTKKSDHAEHPHRAHWHRHDTLTGLPNRIKFQDRLESALAGASRSNSFAALLFINIDQFKSINETLGRHTGDHLLQQLAGRLKAKVRPTDTVARLDGDDFAIILTDLSTPESAVETTRAILASMQKPFDLPCASAIRATASIGLTIAPSRSPDPQKLQQLADSAVSRAKSDGRNRYCVS